MLRLGHWCTEVNQFCIYNNNSSLPHSKIPNDLLVILSAKSSKIHYRIAKFYNLFAPCQRVRWDEQYTNNVFLNNASYLEVFRRHT